MLKSVHTAIALPFAVASLLAAAPARAQNADRALLSTFCDAGNIKESTCGRAKNYPNAGRRACDVTLSPGRSSGKFLISGNPLLVVDYESGCEAHATDNGGAVVFEEIGGRYVFRGFQPGAQGGECVTLTKNERQDYLVCLSGHMGQGLLASNVALMNFTGDAGKGVRISLDFLARAEDTTDAFGANVVTCKERSKYFEFSNLRSGPRPATVIVDAGYADAETIRTVCAKGFPRPKEAIGEPLPGEAFVPADRVKRGTLSIDLATRKVTPQ